MLKYGWLLFLVLIGCEPTIDEDNGTGQLSYVTFPHMNYSTADSLTKNDTLILDYEYNISTHHFSDQDSFVVRYSIRTSTNSGNYLSPINITESHGAIVDSIIFKDLHFDVDTIFRPLIITINIYRRFEGMIVGAEIAGTTIIFDK